MTAPSLGAIVRAHGAAFENDHRVSTVQRKAMRALATCRTPALGGQRQRCDRCGFEHIHWHSCRNRHCPRCQSLASHRWLEARRAELLPVDYFHVVFTIPESLNALARGAPAAFYARLLQSAARALLDVGRTKLRATLGPLCVLHTWGQTLAHHPHVHCVVPGGGFSVHDGRWRSVRSRRFFLPVRVLARRFRTLFTDALRDAWRRGELRVPIKLAADATALDTLLARAARTDWVVYAKVPFAGPDIVLRYLARYTHRIAITDRRIVAVEDASVTFTYRDYAAGNLTRTMRLAPQEFLRRFLLHVLPTGFVRIRSYGFLANRHRAANLARARAQLVARPRFACRPPIVTPSVAAPPLCPRCHQGTLLTFDSIAPAIAPEPFDTS